MNYKDLLRIFNLYNIPFAHLFQKVIDFFAGATSQNDPEEYTYEELCEMMDKGNIEPNRLYKMNYTPLIISDVYESDNNICEIILKGKTSNKFYDEVNINKIITNDALNYNEIKLINPLIINCTSSSISEIKSITLTSISTFTGYIFGKVTDSYPSQYPPIELYLSDLPELFEVLKDDYVNTTISLNKTITPAQYASYLGSLTLNDTINVEAECDRTLNISDLDINGVYNFDRDYEYGIKNKLIPSAISTNTDVYAKPILSEGQNLPVQFKSNLYFLKETDTEIIFTTKTNSVVAQWCELVINKNNYKFETPIQASIHLYINNELNDTYNLNFILYNPKSYNGYITNINYKTENNIFLDIDYDFLNLKYKFNENTNYISTFKNFNNLKDISGDLIIKHNNNLIPFTAYHQKSSSFPNSIISKNSQFNLISEDFIFPKSNNKRLDVYNFINSNNNKIILYTNNTIPITNILLENSNNCEILDLYENIHMSNSENFHFIANRINYTSNGFNIYKRSKSIINNCKNNTVDIEWLADIQYLDNIEGALEIKHEMSNPFSYHIRGECIIKNIVVSREFRLHVTNGSQWYFDGFDGLKLPSGNFSYFYNLSNNNHILFIKASNTHFEDDFTQPHTENMYISVLNKFVDEQAWNESIEKLLTTTTE